MKAMILSAGLGKRMRPLTNNTPKPLLEVGNKPLIVWHIERLRDAGFSEIIINVAYLGYKIIDYLEDGSKFGVNIEYSDEQREGGLETAGGIIKALPLLSDTFLVVNGDIWTDYPFNRNFKLKDNTLGDIVLVDNPPHNRDGDFYYPKLDKKLTFAGIGYYKKELFEGLEYGKRRLAPILFEALDNNRLSMEYFRGKWYDIGTKERLEEINSKI
jgi:MurNAc alpha-1-phosphate uridylyltransferase